MTSRELQRRPLAERLLRFVPHRIATPAGEVEFRQAGPAAGVTHVLMHGIGSGSASWLMQLEAGERTENAGLLAWEAPGYGCSSPVALEKPDAGDYAERLWAWLNALGVHQPITLVGHSLGALMAARAATLRPAQVSRLVLLAPAQGYASASAREQQEKLDARLDALKSPGLQGMAQKRSAAMLSPQAEPELVGYVQTVMSQLNEAGYTQAVHLLVGGDLLADLAKINCPVTVASGAADTITPPETCQRVAAVAGVAWTDLGNAGHACALDAPERVSALLGLTGHLQSKDRA